MMTGLDSMKKKSIAGVLAATMVFAAFAGCGDSDTKKQDEKQESDAGTDHDVSQDAKTDNQTVVSVVDKEFTDRDKDGTYSEKEATIITLDGSSAKVDGGGAEVKGGTVTIQKEGTYLVSGTLAEGQLVVDADSQDKIQIVLKDAEIHCEKSAAIYVKQADKVFLTLAKDSDNSLSGGTEYVDTDDNTVDGVIFSKDDFAINGSGTLNIDANYRHGVVSKDDLVITGGTFTIDAVEQGLLGKDCVKILDGTFELTGQGKGIKSENTEEPEKGNVYLAGGTYKIDTEDDALHAGGSLVIDGGSYTLKSGDDGLHAEVETIVNDGTILISECEEGIEGYRVYLNGGTINVTAKDDGINATAPSDRTAEENMQNPQQAAGGQNPFGGEMPVDGEMPEMPTDGQRPEKPTNGEMPDMPTDGKAPTDANPNGGFGGGFGGGNRGNFGGNAGGGGSMMNDSNAYIKITGGTILLNAGGDGVDSNGSLYVSGGTLYVDGPSNGGDGALDCNGTAEITGGMVIATGTSGMAMGFDENSTQCSIFQNLSNVGAGGAVVLTDANGNELLKWTPSKSYQSVVLSCPEMKQGETYSLATGSETTELTLESVVTSNVTSGGFGGFGGGHGMRDNKMM